MEHTGSTAVEKPLRPEVEKNVEILDGVGIDSAPALKGYVRYVSKPSADTILRIDPKDPLLVRWQYGLGRAVVFTSDAKSRWAADWVTWKGFDRFWTNIFRDLLPHSESGEARADFDSASGDLVVNYQLGQRSGSSGQAARHLHLWSRRISASAAGDRTRRSGLPRADSYRPIAGAVSHSAAGRVARFS